MDHTRAVMHILRVTDDAIASVRCMVVVFHFFLHLHMIVLLHYYCLFILTSSQRPKGAR
jgi:hypothetical protein